jgi:hypothetical protein
VNEPTVPGQSAVPTWVATAIVVGVTVVGAVSVQRWLDRTWATMRKDIDPLAPAAARLQRTRDTFHTRTRGAAEIMDAIGELVRMAPSRR